MTMKVHPVKGYDHHEIVPGCFISDGFVQILVGRSFSFWHIAVLRHHLGQEIRANL